MVLFPRRNRGGRLVGLVPLRRADPIGGAGATRLGSRIRRRWGEAVDGIRVLGRSAPRLLLRGHRAVSRLRRLGRTRPVRPHDDRGRPIRSSVARLAPRPRASHRGPSARARRSDAPGALGSLCPGVARLDRAYRANARGGTGVGAVVISPRPGQSVEPTVERPQEHWWPALPWRTATQYPIVADHAD